jgi:hypothetical protein
MKAGRQKMPNAASAFRCFLLPLPESFTALLFWLSQECSMQSRRKGQSGKDDGAKVFFATRNVNDEFNRFRGPL